MARVIRRCILADTPVTRRGRILPVSLVNLLSVSGLVYMIRPIGRSRRFTGILRFALRKAIRRSLVFGSDMAGLSAKFAVEGPPPQIVVELDLLKAPRRPHALLVASRDIAGRRLALRLRFRAFESDDVARHDRQKGAEG